MWDALVIGGGPAGCLCAAALARESWRVLLADARSPDKRGLADTLPPDACRALRRAFPGVALDHVGTRSRGVLAWWNGSSSLIDYELQHCEPGYTVRRPAIDGLLLRQAAIAGVEVRRSWRCVGVEAGDRQEVASAEFVTPDGRRRERSRVTVVATGRVGVPGLPRRVYLDRQVAYSAIVEGGVTHDWLWVEQSRDGWWYFVRASAASTQIVFVSSAGVAHSRGETPASGLSRALERTSSWRDIFGRLPSIGQVATHDARASAPATVGSPRLLIVGDAAGSVDPLSGHGWRHALQSASESAEHVHDCLRGVRPIDPLTLHRDHMAWFSRHMSERGSVRWNG
jgi:2-polyprenyl-6-methoxyphenol hydroxylase-like FAD-dependent oxidoreductase